MKKHQLMPIASRQHCFLCGTFLTHKNSSEEHVYPRWIQERCGVRDQHLTLLNGMRAAYRSIRINCCKTCNNNHLSALELRVRRIMDAPAGKISDADRQDITLWILKIFYSILIFQTERYVDPKNRKLGKIIDEQYISSNFHIFNILQAIRKPFIYNGPTNLASSTYLFEINELQSNGDKFDWMDDLNSMSLMIRIGNRAAIMCLDGGLHDIFKKEHFEKYEHDKISELQFYEIAAAFFYNNSLIDRPPYLRFMANDKFVKCDNLGFYYKQCRPTVLMAMNSDEVIETLVIPSPLDDDRPPYREWDQNAFLHTCQHFIDRGRLPKEILTTHNYKTNQKSGEMDNDSIFENGA